MATTAIGRSEPAETYPRPVYDEVTPAPAVTVPQPVYHDVPPDLADQARSRSRDQSDTPGDSPWPLSAWPDVPTRFVLCTQDRFFPADFMRRVVTDRLGVVPDEIESGHCVALARPRELADMLAATWPGSGAAGGMVV